MLLKLCRKSGLAASMIEVLESAIDGAGVEQGEGKECKGMRWETIIQVWLMW
jgi:phosphate/sulfate permease